MIAVFQNNDASLHDWRTAHPAGFVLNAPPLRAMALPVGPALLHRADCARLKPPSGAAAKASHPLVCSDDRSALEQWRTENRPRATLALCHYCCRRAA